MGTIYYENKQQTIEVKRIGKGMGVCHFLFTTSIGQCEMTTEEFLEFMIWCEQEIVRIKEENCCSIEYLVNEYLTS